MFFILRFICKCKKKKKLSLSTSPKKHFFLLTFYLSHHDTWGVDLLCLMTPSETCFASKSQCGTEHQPGVTNVVPDREKSNHTPNV